MPGHRIAQAISHPEPCPPQGLQQGSATDALRIRHIRRNAPLITLEHTHTHLVEKAPWSQMQVLLCPANQHQADQHQTNQHQTKKGYQFEWPDTGVGIQAHIQTHENSNHYILAQHVPVGHYQVYYRINGDQTESTWQLMDAAFRRKAHTRW